MTHPHLEGLIPVAVEAFLASTGQAHTVTQLQRDLTTTCMRAALEATLSALPGGGVEGWQPIESAPKKQVLLFYPPMYRMGTKQETHGVYYRIGYPGETPRKPTHWWQLTAPQSSLPTPNPHEADRNG